MKVLMFIWKIWFLIVMIITTLFYFPFVYLTIVILKRYDLTYNIFYRCWAWSILIPIGIFPKKIMRGKFPENQGFILVSNHTSQLDIVVPYTLLSQHFAFLAKRELTKLPLFRTNFRGMNITVDRKSLISGLESLTECKTKLDNKINILIFPEGTRSKNAPGMIPFKSGAFKLAIKEQVPIVPMVFLDNYKRLEGGKGLFKSMAGPGRSRMVVLNPIETKGLTQKDVESLIEKVYSEMEKTLKEFNA